MADNVEVPKKLLGTLVGGLIVSLMGTAFLLGRASVPPPSVVTVTPAVVPVLTVAPPAPSSSQELTVSTPAPPPPPARKPPFPDRQASEVRAYLSAVEEISAGTQDLGNPSDFANDLLNQAIMGDTSGVDSLLAQARQSQSLLLKLRAPESCKEHYRLMSGQMKASVQILQQLKAALETSDSMALTGMARQGAAAQSQARQLEKLTQELRERSQPNSISSDGFTRGSGAK